MKRKVITVIFTVLLLSVVFIQPTHANSAQRHWSGTDSTGALLKDKNCPLVVDKELLTFDVQEFPKNYYNTVFPAGCGTAFRRRSCVQGSPPCYGEDEKPEQSARFFDGCRLSFSALKRAGCSFMYSRKAQDCSRH